MNASNTNSPGNSATQVWVANFEDIKEPGAYVSELTGQLFRVPADSLRRGHSPLVDIVSNAPMNLVKISDDPSVIVSKARTLAANADVKPNF